MKKAVIISGNLAQDHEFIYPYYRLLEEKFKVDVCLLGDAPVKGILGTQIPPNKDHKLIKMSKVKTKNYDLLILPGGAKAMEYLRQDKKTLSIIKDFYKNKIYIGSICHGAQLLISAKIVKNTKISGYYSIEDDINNSGAYYYKGPVVEDKKIITSPHYKYLGDWMKLILSKFAK